MLRKYLVYLDDGELVYKVAMPAKTEKDARKYCEGNGDIVAVKDITNDYPIAEECVYDALKAAHFGQTEIDIICRALNHTGITC